MKKILPVLLACTILASVSCKKEKASNNFTVESITASGLKINTPMAPKQYPGWTLRYWHAMEGDNIFYSTPSNGGASKPQFMLKYNIPANSFTSINASVSICDCPSLSKLLPYKGYLYMIANEAAKYNISSNTWSSINYPASARDNNGFTGIAALNNKIYLLGGKTASTKFKYYDIGSNQWFNAADFSSGVSESELIAVGNKIYALGSFRGNFNSFAVYDPVANTWTTLPNLPFGFQSDQVHNMVVKYDDRFIIMLQNDYLYIYDTVNSIWKSKAIYLQIGSRINSSSIVSNGNKLYVVWIAFSGDFTLYEIKLDNVPN